MIILWITNSLLPEANALLGKRTEVKGTGGWVMSMAKALRKEETVKIHIAAISTLVSEYTTLEGESIIYHAIPKGKGDTKYNTDYEDAYRRICNDINPDVVHIHGTEFPHALAALRACGKERVVVSLQGLVSIIARYNTGGITTWEALKNVTFHDFVRGGIIRQQRHMYKSGEYEIAVLKEAKYVIGRTSFDREHAWAVNSGIKYYHCDEILREEFYNSGYWEYSKCSPYSIFMSQSAFPIKGVHKVVEALGIVKQHHPSVHLRVAGQDLTYRDGCWKDELRLTGYGKIVRKLIKKYDLSEQIFFTGRLNADDMIKEYLNANLFLCPSSIENSPNSLAEAQILGVPSIGSYAGGIPDMMRGKEDFLYRFDDVEMLAYKICSVFELKEKCENALFRMAVRERHNPERITRELVEIYRNLIKE